MNIDQIRDSLALELQDHSIWGELLTDTNPGNYGADFWEVEIDPKNIWVDIPAKTFSFKEVIFSFEIRLGASKGEDSLDFNFTKIASGQGKFEFSDNNKSVVIKDVNVDVDLDLFAD